MTRISLTPSARPLVAAAALAVAAAGCDDGPSTGPERGSRPEALTPVSATSASVEAGSGEGDRLEVQVTGPRGLPLEGVEVRFLLSGGPGRVAPATAATGPEGRARALFLPGERTGEARVRADVPEAPWLAPVTFRRTVAPGRSVRLSRAAGDGQRAEAGSQLPRPLLVSARTPGGEPAPGVRVAFEVADAPDASAALSVDTALTGAEGRASALLTLADDPGPHRVRAVVAGAASADTVRFGAEAVATLASGIRLDSLRPRVPAAGQRVTLYGEGLGGASEIWLDGASAAVSGGGDGRLRARLPEGEECLPRRRASLRLRAAGGGWSNALEAEVAPPEPALRLDVGGSRTLAAPGPGGCLRLPATSGQAYRIAVVGTAASAGALTPLTLRVRSGVGGLGGRGADAGFRPQARGDASRGAPPRRDRAVKGRPALERRLRTAARRELRRRGARPARRARSAPAVPSRPDAGAADVARTPPVIPSEAVGDTVRLHFAVGSDLSVSCADTASAVTGVVRAAGPGVAVVQDTAAPGAFTGADLRLVRDEFERHVLPTDTAYFGPAADIDGNGRVILLLTPRVNDLTPEGSESRVGGFFLPLDLADAGPGGGGVSGEGGAVCPASNEGEVLYLATADPDGRFGPPLDRQGALRNARSIGSHELEHLLSAEQRIIRGDAGFDRLQAVWLAEGMAHLAEEVVGHAALGTRPGENLAFDDFRGSRGRLEAFNTFHLQNFGRLQLFLRSPAATPALSPVDPGGGASLRMRGFGWLFARWLGDRFGGAAGTGATGGGGAAAGPFGEAALFRALSTGGPEHASGVSNVEQATGRAWEELLLDFVQVPLVDDREAPTGPGDAFGGPGQLASWDLRAVYEGLSDNPSARRLFPLGYPLAPARLDGGRSPVALELPAGAPAYFAAGGSTPSPALALRLASPDGTPPPASAGLHLTVIRVR